VVMVAGEPSNHEALEQWLSGVAGRRVAIKVPQRGAKREFMETAVKNAVGLLNAQTLKRGHDLTARSEALRQLQEALSLPEAPYRIECIDISNISGTNVVGALIAFEDALPVKRDYRSYIIRGEAGTDDVAAVREVVSRRFAQQAAGVGMPDLLVVDGGQPQVEAASVALAQMQVQVQVIGLAKRLEEVWLPGQKVPLILPRSSEALFLLQRVRDEAHRAAIGFHRKRRSRAMLSSALDAVPGLGPVKRRALLERFGDVKRLSAASDEEIAAVPGIGPSLAAAIRKSLDAPEPHGQTTQP
ncbi:MAG: excinuclease ABC subunit C, partial [Actinobacteria bacterium]|nr:excinuclease ABC subunit C [Actinomycetota bacterium]